MRRRSWLVTGLAFVAACAAGSNVPTGQSAASGGQPAGTSSVAAGTGGGGHACTPGAQVGCACPGGEPAGVQICKQDGSGYGSCACGGQGGASSSSGAGAATSSASATSASTAASSSSAASSTASTAASSSSAASSASSASSSSTAAASSSGAGDAGPADAAVDAPSGPVAVGSYTYTAINPSGMIDPPAVDWHPKGSYALVLNETSTVWRYDPVAKTVTQAASAGSSVYWRAVRFTPDGTKAVLLGNTNGGSPGTIWLWDDATSQLTQMTSESYVGGTYEAIEWSHDGTQARLLGSMASGGGYIASLWLFDPVTGRSGLKATPTAAGCQDLAWATDGFNQPVVAVTCGLNGVSLFYLDSLGNFTNDPTAGSAGNVSRIAARPQGDYALAIGWSGQLVYRFQQGAWNTSFSSPMLNGIFTARFSTSGSRALILGGYFGPTQVGQVYEFRDDLTQQTDFTDVSIPGFGSPPYNAVNGVQLNDVAWRPGCDGGLIVGGEDTFSTQLGYVIRFSVDNGVACPN